RVADTKDQVFAALARSTAGASTGPRGTGVTCRVTFVEQSETGVRSQFQGLERSRISDFTSYGGPYQAAVEPHPHHPRAPPPPPLITSFASPPLWCALLPSGSCFHRCRKATRLRQLQ